MASQTRLLKRSLWWRMGRRAVAIRHVAGGYFFILFCTAASSLSSSSLRGVHPLDEKYFESEVIKCKDGLSSFTRDRLNDDFCDCIDGTDEPGTSACSRGKFYCRNVGSTPQFLFSSRVNDHICDCCDGSDEYDGIIHCPNTCIMGGNLQYKTDTRHSTSSRLTGTDKREGIKRTLQDLVHIFIDLKVLVFFQLAVVGFLFALLLFHHRVKPRRRRRL